MRTLIVTGGTGDLGRVVVPRLAREYAAIVVYRTAESWQRFPQTGNVTGVRSFEEALAREATPYALVHLAGGFTPSSTHDDYVRMFEMNVLPAVDALAAVGPHLAEGGRVIAISSAASLTTPAGIGAYAASKAALNAVVTTAAHELHERRITVNALLPNTIGTPGVAPERIADTIAFLLSDAAADVTGQLIAMKA